MATILSLPFFTQKTYEIYDLVLTNPIPQIDSGVSTSTSDSLYTSVLHFSRVSLSNAGRYTCTATYDTLDDVSDPVVLTKNIEVTVRGFETHPVNKTADQGSDIVMNCAVVGDQRASISW